uniref:Uncharacterized protein n=1 Tax=Glossina palpalis gambiensis TaxID=67801 RepID=A0A1B0BP40_9MUSC
MKWRGIRTHCKNPHNSNENSFDDHDWIPDSGACLHMFYDICLTMLELASDDADETPKVINELHEEEETPKTKTYKKSKNQKLWLRKGSKVIDHKASGGFILTQVASYLNIVPLMLLIFRCQPLSMKNGKPSLVHLNTSDNGFEKGKRSSSLPILIIYNMRTRFVTGFVWKCPSDRRVTAVSCSRAYDYENQSRKLTSNIYDLNSTADEQFGNESDRPLHKVYLLHKSKKLLISVY